MPRMGHTGRRNVNVRLLLLAPDTFKSVKAQILADDTSKTSKMGSKAEKKAAKEAAEKAEDEKRAAKGVTDVTATLGLVWR